MGLEVSCDVFWPRGVAFSCSLLEGPGAGLLCWTPRALRVDRGVADGGSRVRRFDGEDMIVLLVPNMCDCGFW
jgi:hypothetical protein